MTTIYLEGLIAAGKTTTMSHFTRGMSAETFSIVEEPLRDFQYFPTLSGEVIEPLTEFYQNPSQEAIVVQLHVLDTYEAKLRAIQESGSTTVKIWDRGPDACLIFTRTLYKLGHITKLGYEYWMRRYREIKAKYRDHSSPKGIFFIDTPIDVCLQRQRERGRLMEKDFGDMKNYLHVLRETYMEYLTTTDAEVKIVSQVLCEDNLTNEFKQFVNSVCCFG